MVYYKKNEIDALYVFLFKKSRYIYKQITSKTKRFDLLNDFIGWSMNYILNKNKRGYLISSLLRINNIISLGFSYIQLI